MPGKRTSGTCGSPWSTSWGAVETELAGHNRPEIRARLTERFAREERMQASDIAEIIGFIVTRKELRRTAINEVLVRPTEQDR